MSHTYRRIRKNMNAGMLDWFKKSRYWMNGKVRDGVLQYVSPGCSHHSSCPWCTRNRLFAHERRMPLLERN